MTQPMQEKFQKSNSDVIVIGAGLAGSEAAFVLARAGLKVLLFEQKPKFFSAAHKLNGAAELVCSNSFKSLEVASAHGLLKEELRLLSSPVLECALEARVPGGKALSVDREKLSALVSEKLKSHPLIEWRSEQVEELPKDKPTLIATGPLTSDALIQNILKLCGDTGLYFYDATSPVVALDSLDLTKFFWGSRNQESGDYLNLPLSREEYENFCSSVLAAEKTESHMNEELKFFEGCLPLEVIAERGPETLKCCCMSPEGFERHTGGQRPYAVIQFRREKAAGELLSMVGFQTRMKWPEQERVFRSLPGMKDAQFMRLGAMHRNTFINAPLHLNDRLQLKYHPNFFMAGQITGSEGYTEALATGHYAALQMIAECTEYKNLQLPETTALRSLVRYLIQSDPRYFQPMNFNFGLLPALSGKIRKGVPKKLARNQMRAERAIADITEWLQKLPEPLRNLLKISCDNREWKNASAPIPSGPEASTSAAS